MIPDIVEIKRLCASGQWFAKIENSRILLHDTVAGETVCIGQADAKPVRHAQWVTDDLGNTLCSNCKSRIPYYKEYDMDDDYGGEYDIEIAETNYCPNCGAKMENPT